MDSVMRPIVSDVETARVVLLVDLLFLLPRRGSLGPIIGMAARGTMILL
jgi:hypothetical protein